RNRTGDAGDRRRGGRRNGDRWRARRNRRHATGRDPARHDRAGPDLYGNQCVLGEGYSGRHHLDDGSSQKRAAWLAAWSLKSGRAWRMPVPAAALTALVIGALGGAMNALLIARWKIPAIIVTLGSFSLFRGVAEGITHGAVNYSGFPAAFLSLGQGYLWGVVPVQAPIFALAFAGYAILLQRSAVGRTLYAIGFGESG